MSESRKIMERFTCNGYSSFHCWYYRSGGVPLLLKQIKTMAEDKAAQDFQIFHSGQGNPNLYWGIVEEAKPETSHKKLRTFELEYSKRLAEDVSGYKRSRRALTQFVKSEQTETSSYSDPFTSLSLKHNHVYGCFYSLAVVALAFENCAQADLFG